MTWRVLAASAVGTSHLATGAACEDSCLVRVETGLAKLPLLTIFVSDGAGSAAHGGTGAELAVEAAAEFVRKQYAKPFGFDIDGKWATGCIQAVQAKIFAQAEQQRTKARDYACTFLGLVGSPINTLLMQIGDGGIVVDVGNGLEMPITPMMGEYANMTNFVTEEKAMDLLEVVFLRSRALKAAVFSDGIQRLALDMTTNTAHTPFFTPFFSALAKATSVHKDHLQAELERFLQSPAVNERTDDDKTMALAYWTG